MQILAMAAQIPAAANSSINFSEKLSKMIADGLQDYNCWRSLILEIETALPEDENTISLAYDSFLSKFPLCHWHLEKYAYQKSKFCNSQEAVNIYERGVEVAMFSVGFWADYFTFAAACFGSPMDIRRLFERAISFVGKDYFSHALWDKYMKYEFSQEGWSFLAQSYIWALRFPTKKLHFYYDNFKQFVANLEEEIGYDKSDDMVERLSVPCAAIKLSKEEVSLVIKDMLESSNRSLKSKALDRYRSIGENFYLEARQIDEKIKRFETKIQRRYFDVTPLNDDQLNNWHIYLDFIEKQDNLDWTMKLYERCLIPCANYPEFWMRYVEFLESKGGRELAISALARATQIFLKSVPEIHLFNARFKEHIGDANGARAALALCDPKSDSSFIESIAAQANLERRLGNYAAASAIYEKALKRAREKRKLHVLPSLYSHFARLTFLITGSAAASRDVLIEGIRQVPRCRFLLEELIKFAMTHEGANHVSIIDSIIADAISPGLDENGELGAKDREKISCLFIEFVNLCGTMHDIIKAGNRHIRLFPQSLRIKTAYKHPASGDFPIGLARDREGSDPSTNRRKQLHGQELVSELQVNSEVHPKQLVREVMPFEDQSNNVGDKVQVLSTNEVISNVDEYWDSRPEDGHGTMVVSAEFFEQTKENALTVRDSDQDTSYQSRGDELGPMDVSANLGIQSKEDSSKPPKSAHEVGKSTETTESIEASHSSLPRIQQELDHELNMPKHSVSSDHISVKSQEKESQELIPMSCDEYETKRNVLATSESNPHSFASPKSIHSVESVKVCCESERDGSVSCQLNTSTEAHADPEEPSSTHEDSIEIDSTAPARGHAASSFQDREFKLDRSPCVDHHPADQQRSQSDLGAVLVDKATNLDQRMDISTPSPSINMSGGQLPVSSQPVSSAQENTDPSASATTQQQWQAQQSLAMNQMMLQYHYQQQQLLHQQYQQQMHMQNPYFQMQPHYMNHQPYQVQPQPHNQEIIHPQQSTQQQSQQQSHQHQQIQQGHEPVPNSQQVHDKQYQQSQELAYQAQQLAYQQQWQQYQQYQSYQLVQQQQQSKEMPSINMQGHHMHQYAHAKQNLVQQMSQNQQGSKRATPDYDTPGPSESPSLEVQSPQALQ